jgi:hypothetical protein
VLLAAIVERDDDGVDEDDVAVDIDDETVLMIMMMPSMMIVDMKI